MHLYFRNQKSKKREKKSPTVAAAAASCSCISTPRPAPAAAALAPHPTAGSRLASAPSGDIPYKGYLHRQEPRTRFAKNKKKRSQENLAGDAAAERKDQCKN